MSSDGRRRVNFSDSPPGGSKSSSRHNSDSGVGSSDHRPTSASGANPDRGFTERDVQRQWNDLGALQDAYRTVYDNEKHLKAKLRNLEEENARLRRNAKDDETRWRDQLEEIKKLREDREKYDGDRKALAERNGQLEGENNALMNQVENYRAHIEDLERQLRGSPVPAVMSGALPDGVNPKPKRRESVSRSKRESTKDKEAREARDAEKEKKRLAKRFDPKDSSETSKPPNSSRTRRQSYIEPLGPAGPSSRPSSSIPPSPIVTTPTSRQFPAFTQAPTMPTTYAQPREPTYSDLPRKVLPSVHPSVTVSGYEPIYADEGVAWKEDGSYHPYPLPKPPKSRHLSSKYSG